MNFALSVRSSFIRDTPINRPFSGAFHRRNTLRKQRKSAENFQVLRVSKQAQGSFNFAATNAKPTLEAIIRDGPVQGGMVLSELAKVAVVELRSHPKLIGYAGRHVEPEVRKGAAALIAVHRQPIVCVRVDEAL